MTHKYSLDRKMYPEDETIAKGMLLGVQTVKEWEQGGHLFRIDVIKPKQIGASMRHYDLFMDGKPASGGRYHSTLQDAEERAEFVAAGSMAHQIRVLEGRLTDCRWNIANKITALEAALEALESYHDGNDKSDNTIAIIKCALDNESVDVPFVGRTPWR